MISFESESADGVWRQVASRVRNYGVVQEGRDQPAKELLHVACAIGDPRQRLVFARPMNPAFAVVEVIWVLAGANDVGFLRFWNPRMTRYVDEGGAALHGAYGHRLGSRPQLRDEVADALRRSTHDASAGLDQLRSAAEALLHDPNSRQVVLQYWDAARDMPLPKPRSRDVPCNVMSHLLVRNGRLEWLQVLRSNDLIWGMPYNFVQFTSLQEIVAGWLGVDVGSYQQVSSSLHAYERHWLDLDAVDPAAANVPRNGADLRIGPYRRWEQLWGQLIDCTLGLAALTEVDALIRVAEDTESMPPAYREWVWLLAAEALRRRGHEAAHDVVEKAGAFWSESWHRWVASIGAVQNPRQLPTRN